MIGKHESLRVGYNNHVYLLGKLEVYMLINHWNMQFWKIESDLKKLIIAMLRSTIRIKKTITIKKIDRNNNNNITNNENNDIDINNNKNNKKYNKNNNNNKNTKL